MHTTQPLPLLTSRPARAFALIVGLSACALMGACTESATASAESAAFTLVGEQVTASGDLRARVRRVERAVRRAEDREAIETVAACYGRAQDVLFLNWQDREAGRLEALDIFRTCFTEDVEITLFFLNSPEPASQTFSLSAWVDFVVGFAEDGDYTSARHLIGNVLVESIDGNTARMVSESLTPHFIRHTGTDPAPTADFITGNYVDELVRGPDGVWRTYKKIIVADEYWRGQGVYPIGQASAE